MEEPPAKGQEFAICFEVIAVCLLVVVIVVVF